tara:strand:- start:1334 stop:2038 length:705 start_codon:yes stop_codon:yes gene_type:complete
MANFKAITTTTYGYKDLTLNLLKSIEKNNIDLDIEVFVSDNKSEIFFQEHTKNINKFDEQNVLELNNLLPYGSENFAKVMIQKLKVIHSTLLENEYVLYIDGDIVIKKNIKNFLLNKIKKNDIVFQNDKRPSKPNLINVCAGFMMIKSNKKMIKFFDPQKLPVEKILGYKTHDQTHINRNLSKFKYEILSLNDFPNGPHFYTYKENLDPAIIHFNYLDSTKKIPKMKELNEWYL